MISTARRRPRHVEISVQPALSSSLSQLNDQWQLWLESVTAPIPLGKDGEIDHSLVPETLARSSIRIVVRDDDDEIHWKTSATTTASSSQPSFTSLGRSKHRYFVPGNPFLVHSFVLSTEEIGVEELEPAGGGGGGDDEWTAGCDNLTLPHVSTDGLWESLIFDSNVKCSLLDYAQSALLFSDRGVSSHVVQWNRILLLHGVPGTGKTSLCRALAHKLAIRLGGRRFPRATLLEVHSHSLFSKWFSTSGKLVSTLFQMVRDMVEDDPSTLVFVLIDEVESLASSRGGGGGSGGGDPSDAMRAVNSLLTSLDRLRSYPNVLVLATTNLTGSVDAAFVDRVDLKLHIGLPILKARYQILQSCLEELIRVGIIIIINGKRSGHPQSDNEANHHPNGGILDIEELYEDVEEDEERKDEFSSIPGPSVVGSRINRCSRMLLECAKQSEGLSGRSLRRLPLQSHAQFIQNGGLGNDENAIPLDTFLEALLLGIQYEQQARVNLCS